VHIEALTPRSRKLHVASTFQGILDKKLSNVTLNVANIGDVDDGKFKRRRKVHESPITHVILPLILIKKVSPAVKLFAGIFREPNATPPPITFDSLYAPMSGKYAVCVNIPPL
jgi:hypothetical protein